MDNKENENKKLPYGEILKTLAVFIVAFAVIIIVAQTINWLFIQKQKVTSIQPPPPTQQATSTPVVTCPTDPTSALLTIPQIQSVDLVSSRISAYAANGKFVQPNVVITKSDTSNSKFACGYLITDAGTITYGALQNFEDVYVNPNGYGGHLDRASAISEDDGALGSNSVYSLNKIQYWPDYSGRNTLLTADWAALLNVSDHTTFVIDLNTNDKTGFINKISIAYKCYDPQTGLENTGCKLEVQK